VKRIILAITVGLVGLTWCIARETTAMKRQSVDAAIEDIRVDGRWVQRLWCENDKLLLSVSGPAVVDLYAKKAPGLIGRAVFRGSDDEPRLAKHDELVPLTPQDDGSGAAGWVCSLDASDRKNFIRPWGYNSFSDDSSRPGYGARTGFQVQSHWDGRVYCDAVFGNIPTPGGHIQGTLAFEMRPGEGFVRMRLGAPGPYYNRRSEKAKQFRGLRIGLAMARLAGEKVSRGKGYISVYAENPEGPAKKIGLGLIYDTTRYKAYVETKKDRVIYFQYEPIKHYAVPMWLVAGWDGDGSATSASQWERHVKRLAEQFAREQQVRPGAARDPRPAQVAAIWMP